MQFFQIAALLSFSGLISAAPQLMALLDNSLAAPATAIKDRASLEARNCCSKDQFALCIFSGAINPACRNVPDCRYTRSCLEICGGVVCS